MPKFQTILRIDDTGIEVPIVIRYSRVLAYDGGRESPSEPAHCSVWDVYAAGEFDFRNFGTLCDVLNADSEMQSALMADWEADDADHEERRGDRERDDRLTGGWR